jgi:GTPase
MVDKISPENDEGNKEYKLKLLNASSIDHLTTQMRYRIDQGAGEAIYILGVTDSGEIVGLTPDEYKTSLDILNQVAKKNDYTLTLISEHKIGERTGGRFEERTMYEFLVRENNRSRYVEIRVACAGNVDAGKSSLTGVLLTGKNDNGRGSARLNVFNYKHEMKSGRTSSIAQHILGFDERGAPVHHIDELGYRKSWQDVVTNSCKIVTFFDLCGHEKYLKTTILGLTSQFPDLVFILVGGNMGMSKMTREHIFLCLSLHIPFVIIITKIDICKDRQEVLQETVKDIKQLLTAPGISRFPYDMKTDEDVTLNIKNIHSLTTVPIFYISNVTGEGVQILRNFLNLYPKKPRSQEVNNNKVELYVDQTFKVDGVGTVIGGQLVSGKVSVGDKLIVGPNNDSYSTIQVRSIHCKRVPVTEVESGCYVCLGVKKPDSVTIRRGNVVLSILDKPVQVNEFEADIFVQKSITTTIKPGYEPVLHSCSIRQTARILSISNKKCARRQETTDNILRTGDRATVRFQFCYRPEFIKSGFRLLLAEGRVKIIGKITGISEEIVKVET